MKDLNDIYFFVEVVRHGGFAAAGRALGQAKSMLSRRISRLEKDLGIRLIERSTRHFKVTDTGAAFYESCCNVLLAADSAFAVAAEAQGEAHGLIRFSCPTGMLETIRPMTTSFLAQHPGVQLHLRETNRPIDLIEERIDVALRVRASLDTDASLTMRKLATSRRILVASPTFPTPPDIDTLAATPTLSFADQAGDDIWHFTSPENKSVRVTPRLTCGDLITLRDAAIAGLGVASLPDHFCRDAIAAGKIREILPDWHQQDGIVHLVFTTKRGLPPAVRAFIEHLAAGFHSGGWQKI